MNSISIKERINSLFKKENWHLWVLALIAIFSFFLNFYLIEKTGYGNAYYAAAIKSMTQNFKNFFYVSFDPAGMVSVDKPPLALWVQALFVMVFGYHGWAMLLPQALAATGSSIMMYILTSKYFGKPAGLISALVLAITPAVVVAARNNTMDTQLVFVLLVATWFLFKSIEKGKWRYLFWCAAFIGLGFNIKMLQAYMIVPSVVIVYLFFAKEKLIKRLAAGIISVVILFAVSFAWVIAVDLTPADSRPYVDSSSKNSIWELIVGHNGLERVNGRGGGAGVNIFGTITGNNGRGGNIQLPQGGQQNIPNNFTPPNQTGATQWNLPQFTPNQNNADMDANSQNNIQRSANAQNSTQQRNSTTQPPTQRDTNIQNGNIQNFNQRGPQNNGGGFGGFGGAGNEIGNAGILRLFSKSMYGQASWLIILALFGVAACIGKFNDKKQLVQTAEENTENKSKKDFKYFLNKFGFKNLNLKQGVFVYWTIWLAIMFLFFSFAGFYHRYYLCMMAPGIAGLAGIGIVQMYKDFRDKNGWRMWLLPASLVATSGVAAGYVWVYYTALQTTLVPIILISAGISLVLMAINYFKSKKIMLNIAVALMMISVLTGPLYWSLTVTLNVPQNVTMPYAGPELASTNKISGMTPNQTAKNTTDNATNSLEKYLVSHYKQGSYLVVGRSANDVADFIVDTGLPAVAYGGFMGSDNSLTVDKLKQLVAQGKVTYFLIGGGLGGNSNNDITSYVKQNAKLIDPSQYGGSTASRGSLYLFE